MGDHIFIFILQKMLTNAPGVSTLVKESIVVIIS
jgi:hypothetical protein